MASKTNIANLAILHLGVGKEIADIELDKSQEATACRRFFDIAKERCLKEIHWPFAKRSVALGLVASNPNSEWLFSYRYPSDALSIVKIESGSKLDSLAAQIKFKIFSDDTGRLIYTDRENAAVEYVKNIVNTEAFSPEFTLALSFLLASYVAPKITGGDPFNKGPLSLVRYDTEIKNATRNSLNESNEGELPESQLVTTRS